MPRSERVPTRVKITKRVVDAAVCPPPPKESWIWDPEIPGFSLRLRGGRKVYVLWFGTGRRGRARKTTIGEHGLPWRPDPVTGLHRTLTADLAREEAIRLRGIAATGGNPGAERKAARAMPTVTEFGKRYLKDYSTPKKAAAVSREEARLLKKIVRPALGATRLDHVDNAMVTQLHVSRRKTPVTANRVLSLISHMYTKAVHWKVLPGDHLNPCKGVERFPERKRKRYLSAHELAVAGAALAAAEQWGEVKRRKRPKGAVAASPTAIAAIRCIIFTGSRASEVLELERSHLHLEDGLALRPRKGSDDDMPIYLPAPALEVIESLPQLAYNEHLFPGRKRGSHLTLSGLEHIWRRIRDAAGLQDVRIHDLRHSFASVAAAGGQTLYIIGALLGHTRPETTQRYAHLAADPVRAAAEATAKKLQAGLKAPVTARTSQPLRKVGRR